MSCKYEMNTDAIEGAGAIIIHDSLAIVFTIFTGLLDQCNTPFLWCLSVMHCRQTLGVTKIRAPDAVEFCV
jgi:hypothetical protein